MPTQEDIEQQLKLLQVYRQTLSTYVEQRAKLGSAYAPPGIIHGILEAREQIRKIKHILYDWKVEFEDHLDDEEVTIDRLAVDETYRVKELSERERLQFQSLLQLNKIAEVHNYAVVDKGFVEIAARALEHSTIDTFQDGSNDRSVQPTDEIDLIIKSKRFGNKTILRVHLDMKVWAFLECVIEKLNLPRETRLAGFAVTFRFLYSIFAENPTSGELRHLNKLSSLREEGLTTDNELYLQVDVLIIDPQNEESTNRVVHTAIYERGSQYES
jgi:hypothetical protein